MSVSETAIPDTQDRELNGATQTTTEPTPDPATDVATEAITDLPADLTTEKHALEGVRKGLTKHTPTSKVGSLTFTSGQTTLTPEQRAAIASLGIDPDDPIARAHVRRFIHVCQLWNVDPWSGEIHLVQRGSVWDDGTDKRSWTIQTGIDGYRRRAREVSANPDSPVRWIGKAKWMWSYGDDDPDGRGWREVRDEDTGDLVLEPVWYKAWPDNRQPPALAKAVIIVEDKATGQRRVEEFVANWKMFAVYENVYNGRKKAYNDDGSPKMRLGSFWAKGPQHMLAKCAEAQVLRAVFHGHFHGVYTDEEMHRADAEAAEQLEQAVARRRRDAFRQAQQDAEQAADQVGATGQQADAIRAAALTAADTLSAPPKVVPGMVEPDDDPQPDPPTAAPTHPAAPAPEPIPVATALNQMLALPEERRRELLLAELDWISDLIGKDVRGAMLTRSGTNPAAMSADQLIYWIGPLRATTVVPHLRAAGRDTEADAYASFGPRYVASTDVLTGRADPACDAIPELPGNPQEGGAATPPTGD